MENLINRDFFKHVETFCEDLDDISFLRLHEYLLYGYIDNEPNEIQQKFIEVFFGQEDWETYIRDIKGTDLKYFTHSRPTAELLRKCQSAFAFLSTIRLKNVLIQYQNEHIKNIDLEIGKVDLGLAILKAIKASLEDGVFSKIEGWCNVYDVLIEHNVIEPIKDI